MLPVGSHRGLPYGIPAVSQSIWSHHFGHANLVNPGPFELQSGRILTTKPELT